MDNTTTMKLLALTADPRCLRAAPEDLSPVPYERGPLPQFDLCIVDDAGLRRHRQGLAEARGKSAPTFLPVLLMSAAKRVPSWAWSLVDDVVMPGDARPVARTRVVTLLRSRRQALALRAQLHLLQRQDEELALLRERLSLRTRELRRVGPALNRAIGLLARGFQAPLRALGSYGQLLAEVGRVDDEVVREIAESSERIARLLSGIVNAGGVRSTADGGDADRQADRGPAPEVRGAVDVDSARRRFETYGAFAAEVGRAVEDGRARVAEARCLAAKGERARLRRLAFLLGKELSRVHAPLAFEAALDLEEAADGPSNSLEAPVDRLDAALTAYRDAAAALGDAW